MDFHNTEKKMYNIHNTHNFVRKKLINIDLLTISSHNYLSVAIKYLNLIVIDRPFDS